ncbi:3218_t:CDS:2 [Paraglomus brasilianum]|uniref:3218_t:CDS:1 n=1 Tax=Paraglomus brasilianum TaxID=144538 RepID=A0A9N9FES5_9GLOM|nr:3218_t:CDS:2 [Paraglomus brasilianum]
MAESSFAETQLKKYGWSRGKGLGKNLEGRSKAITVKQKKDSAGLGLGSYDWSFPWWEHLYNSTLQNIGDIATNDKEKNKVAKPVVIPRTRTGIISTDEVRWANALSSSTDTTSSTAGLGDCSTSVSASVQSFKCQKMIEIAKQSLYGNFVKGTSQKSTIPTAEGSTTHSATPAPSSDVSNDTSTVASAANSVDSAEIVSPKTREGEDIEIKTKKRKKKDRKKEKEGKKEKEVKGDEKEYSKKKGTKKRKTEKGKGKSETEDDVSIKPKKDKKKRRDERDKRKKKDKSKIDGNGKSPKTVFK